LGFGAAITFSLDYAGPIVVSPGATVTLEVRADYDTPLVTARFNITADGEPDATLLERSANPTTPQGLTFISPVSQAPFDPALPHDLHASPASEVLLDLDFDDEPGGPTDGLAPGTDVQMETLNILVAGCGTLVLTINDVSAAHTDGVPSGQLFNNAEVNPQADVVTLYVNHPGDINQDGHINLVDFSSFAICFGQCQPGSAGQPCPAGQFARSDLNNDGCVDLVDFSTFAVYFGTR
jgi:hypothetical protein